MALPTPKARIKTKAENALAEAIRQLIGTSAQWDWPTGTLAKTAGDPPTPMDDGDLTGLAGFVGFGNGRLVLPRLEIRCLTATPEIAEAENRPTSNFNCIVDVSILSSYEGTPRDTHSAWAGVIEDIVLHRPEEGAGGIVPAEHPLATIINAELGIPEFHLIWLWPQEFNDLENEEGTVNKSQYLLEVYCAPSTFETV